MGDAAVCTIGSEEEEEFTYEFSLPMQTLEEFRTLEDDLSDPRVQQLLVR